MSGGRDPEGPGVVVVGAINVDLVVAVDRLPHAGETVVGPRLERHGGGKGANAAVAAARSGARVRLMGAVGADATGRQAVDELRSEGVDVGDVAELEDEPTGVALIVVDARGENQIAVGAGANAAVETDRIRTAVTDALPTTGCVLVSTEIPGPAVTAAVEAATVAGVSCVLNPAPPIPAVLDLLDAGPVLTPNATELEALAEALGVEPAPEAGLEAVAQRAGALARRTREPVVVTLGGEGALLVWASGDVEHVAAPVAEVRDTTGAGDTFNGVLAAGLALGEPILEAVRTAVAAASGSVEHVGARVGMPHDGSQMNV